MHSCYSIVGGQASGTQGFQVLTPQLQFAEFSRAQDVAGAEPDHYIFPACENGKIDPVTAQKSWRSAWRSLRKAAGLQHLRFHDLRHHATTELAESGASDQTIMSTTAISAFQMYEIHTTQQGTQVHPGDTLNLDYSLTHVLSLQRDLNLQVGLVGYEQWQLTDKTGPSITPAQSSAHYRFNALGFASSLMLPPRNVSVGIKYFKEFECQVNISGIFTSDHGQYQILVWMAKGPSRKGRARNISARAGGRMRVCVTSAPL